MLIAILAVSLIGSSRIYAQSSEDNNKPASSTGEIIIPRTQYEAIKAAVDELAAARSYIKALEASRDAQKELLGLQEQRATVLEAIVKAKTTEAEAERSARVSTEKALDAETRRADMLERQVKRRGGGFFSTTLKVAAVVVGAAVLIK